MEGLLIAAAVCAAAVLAVVLLPGRIAKGIYCGERVIAVVVPGKGAQTMERTLRAVSRVKSVWGIDLTVLVADDALSGEGKRIAEITARGRHYITVCGGDEAARTVGESLCQRPKIRSTKSNTSSLKDV